MSEKTKETDIVERLEKEAASIKHQVRGQDPADWKEIGLMQEAADCITRLRADRLIDWREGIEAAAKVCEAHAEFCHKEAHSGGDFEHLVARRTEAAYLAQRIRALVPPGDKEKGETNGAV